MVKVSNYRIALFTKAEVPTKDSRQRYAYLWCEPDYIGMSDITTGRLYYGKKFEFTGGMSEVDGQYDYSFVLYDGEDKIIYEAGSEPPILQQIHSLEGYLVFLDHHQVKRYLIPYLNTRGYCEFYLDDPSNAYFRRVLTSSNTGNILALRKVESHTILSLGRSLGWEPGTLRVKDCSGEILAHSQATAYRFTLEPAGITVQEIGDEKVLRALNLGVYRSGALHYFELQSREYREGVIDYRSALRPLIRAPFERLEGSISVSAKYGDEQVVEYIIEPFLNPDGTWLFRKFDPARREIRGFESSPYDIGNLLKASYRVSRWQGVSDYWYALLGILWDRQYPNSFIVERFI